MDYDVKKEDALPNYIFDVLKPKFMLNMDCHVSVVILSAACEHATCRIELPNQPLCTKPHQLLLL